MLAQVITQQTFGLILREKKDEVESTRDRRQFNPTQLLTLAVKRDVLSPIADAKHLVDEAAPREKLQRAGLDGERA